MFGDSSQDVFWAVGFLRARLSSSNKTEISFIFGKARVSPMKGLSIPKLELQAALLATRLKDDIVTALNVWINHVYMWTDSTTVLQWLNSTEKLPVFVANRVDEILESTTIDEWHHVLSGNNPADTGTRGIYSEALKDSSWVIGPSILRTTDWPFIPDERVINEIRLKGPSCDVDNCVETSSSFVTNVTSIKHPEYGSNWERFISFTRYKRVVAFMLRMLPSYKHFRGKDLRITDPLELDIAESKLIHLAQMESFPVESKTPSTDKPTNNSSKIATAWSMHTVRHDWQRPTLLDFNNWLKEKAEGMKDYVYFTLRQKTRNQLNQKQPKFLQPIVRWLVKLRISLSFRLAFCVRVVMHCRTVLFSRKRMLLCEQKT